MLYWISTGLVSAMLTLSAGSYLFHKATIDGIKDLGFPDFFRIELAILKLIAVVVLLAPQVPIQFKEWAYAGVALFFITAIIAHYAHGDSFVLHLVNIFFLVMLVMSNYTLTR